MFQHLDYIKIDCEGAELSILHGGKELINRFRPIISVEYGYGGYSYFSLTKDSLYDWCKSMNYYVLDLFGNLIASRRMWTDICDAALIDYILVPEEKLAWFWTKEH